MRTKTVLSRIENDIGDILAKVEGRLFHVTTLVNLSGIEFDGAIKPNTDGSRTGGFGRRPNAFFARRGCVSLFDYRVAPAPENEIKDFRSRCPFIQPAVSKGSAAILLIDETVAPQLVPWTQWSVENALEEMVVPYVEIGHRGPLSLERVTEIVVFELTPDDSDPFVASMRSVLPPSE